MRLSIAALAAALFVSCAPPRGAPAPTPTPLPAVELKYRVMDTAGRPWFCDRDFYPIAREDERAIALRRFAEVQADPAFAVMLVHLGIAPGAAYTDDQKLALYREWKTLGALTLQPVTDQAYGFAYLAQRAGKSGERIDGRVSPSGRVTILHREPSGPPNCPICLARGTRIDTPSGERAVEDLQVGDVVWTQDASGSRVAAPLVAIGSTPVSPTHVVVRLVLSDGRVVVVSPGHPTADRRRVGDLVAGDVLDGARVVSAQRVAYDGGATFDVRPAGPTGVYWANAVALGSTLASPRSSAVRNSTIRP